MLLPDGRVESNGNFHGAPVAYALDFLAIPMADVASISERRTDRMLDVRRSHGLPAFLADDPGVDSGLMIAQYTQAGIVERAEAARGAGQCRLDPVLRDAGGPRLDGVGRRPQAARGRSTRCARVLAIELLTAARALDLRAPLRPAPATAAAVAALRERVRGPGADRWLSPEIEAAVEAVRTGELLAAAETVSGSLD